MAEHAGVDGSRFFRARARLRRGQFPSRCNHGAKTMSFMKKSVAVLLATATPLTMTPARAVEPATVMAVASVASTALSLGAKGDGVPMALLQANLQATIAVHARMDNVEKTLGEILKSIAELSLEVRKVVDEELQRNRVGDTLGAVSSIHERIAALRESESGLADQQIQTILANLLVWRNTLIARPDTVVPA